VLGWQLRKNCKVCSTSKDVRCQSSDKIETTTGTEFLASVGLEGTGIPLFRTWSGRAKFQASNTVTDWGNGAGEDDEVSMAIVEVAARLTVPEPSAEDATAATAAVVTGTL